MLTSLALTRRNVSHHHVLRRKPNSFRLPVSSRQFNNARPAYNAHIHDNALRNTVFTVNFFGRFAKFSLLGFLAIGISSWTAFEGAHMWVENVELATEKDEETKKWEWDKELETWSGGSRGGTDAALGFKGRHAVRSAWIAQNWGTGSGASVIGSKKLGTNPRESSGSLNIVEGRLEFAQEFLGIAISIAESKQAAGTLKPQTLFDLLSRHASVLERIGSNDALFESRRQLERVWAGHPGKGVDAARVSLKLGDLNSRLGEKEDALVWWTRAINLLGVPTTQNTSSSTPALTPNLPSDVPASPLAQRVLASTLVSLSAFYATSGQLRQARALEEASLDLLRRNSTTGGISEGSPSSPQALHAMYLLHRSSLISIHLAEVLFSLHEPTALSIQWLQNAADSAERVALALTGQLPSSFNLMPASLLPPYKKSFSMNKPATSLLRDAKRSAAEAWNLMGILTEEADPKDPERALACFEKALLWAGVVPAKAGITGEAGEGMLGVEWQALRSNYLRVQRVVQQTRAT